MLIKGPLKLFTEGKKVLIENKTNVCYKRKIAKFFKLNAFLFSFWFQYFM